MSTTDLRDNTKFILIDSTVNQCTNVSGLVSLWRTLLAHDNEVMLTVNEIAGMRYLLTLVENTLNEAAEILSSERQD